MNKEIEQILVRNLSGEADGDDIIQLSEWLALSEENKRNFQKIKKYWDAEVAGVKMSDSSKSAKKLISKIRKNQTKPLTQRIWFQGLNFAVAATLAGICIYLGFFKSPEIPGKQYTYITGNSISNISLPDGTEITLNKNTKLTYTEDYGELTRNVHLEGEAYFNVVKNVAKAFVVNLDGPKITVLGTSFCVRNRFGENTIKATLLEGSISFEAPNQNILLCPDQELSYNKLDNKVSIDSTIPEVATAWKNHLIKYQSITFLEFISMIKDQYDVSIEINENVSGDKKLTGTFDANLPVERILDIMKKNVSFKWTKEGDKYVITK